MTSQQRDAEDPRVEPFARFMQARDARTFEVQDTNGDFQTWDGIGELGREEYLKDAAAYVKALDIIERPASTTELSGDVPENWNQIKQVAVLLAHIADPDSTVTVTEFAQAEAVIKYLSPHLPTREQISTAVGAVLFNASNYPRPAVPHILGQDIGPLRATVTDAVFALISQPIPTADEHCTGGDDCTALKHVHGCLTDNGACSDPDEHPTAPPRIADMVPGTRAAVERADLVLGGFVQHDWASSTSVHEWYLGELRKLRDAVDPSRIRDVTPPPTTPEEGI